MNEIIKYVKTNNLVDDVCQIIEYAQQYAYRAVDNTLTLRNWYIGKRVAEEDLEGKERAEYGKETINTLSKKLTLRYGKGYTRRALYQYLDFYRKFPGIVYEASTQSDTNEIVYEPRTQSNLLSWTHYRELLQVNDEDARLWYAKEALQQTWSTTTLQRNISSQYYYRTLKAQDKDAVKHEMEQITAPLQNKLEFIKNPVIAEFLGMQSDTSYLESDLEQCIIDNLQKFLMELGKGYAFVARQQHIHTEKSEYYIDYSDYWFIPSLPQTA